MLHYYRSTAVSYKLPSQSEQHLDRAISLDLPRRCLLRPGPIRRGAERL